jgi:predicted transcriptional regulator
MRKRRDRLNIIAEILNVAQEGSLKTQIMYNANLSFAQLEEYLNLLLQINLLRLTSTEDRTIYKTTKKGLKYLQNYEKISTLLGKEEKARAHIIV